MDISNLSVNAIRMLGVDAIAKAKSGHPGMVLGSAPMIYSLYSKHLNADPKNPKWFNRDRFVLAAGHASMLLYATLHLCGYDISMDDITKFRQLNSKTPGHPEYLHTPGIDCTSGPLGQGIAHAVGMAMAEVHLAKKFNKPQFPIVDHYTYVLCGDGDLYEGVTHEAISMAGRYNLKKLIVIYDCNDVTLDGPLGLAYQEDTKARFEACNWNVLEVSDGNDLVKFNKALERAKESDKPTLIITHTVIGYGSINQGTSKVHGAPLASDDIEQLRKFLNWNDNPFFIPDEVYNHFNDTFTNRGTKAHAEWEKMFEKYKSLYPTEATYLEDDINGLLPSFEFPKYELHYKEASRKTSGTVLNLIARRVGGIVGGSADVAGSTFTDIEKDKLFDFNSYNGRNIRYGIREFAMSCAQSGMLLHGGIRSFIGVFAVFADYLKPSIRTAALMKLPAIYILTHDSIAVGEDGPTHQPIEQVSSLRLVPNLITFRPCSAVETTYAWKYALEAKDHPTAMFLTRQNIEVLSQPSYEDFVKGAYVVKDEVNPDYVLIATGSEVELAYYTSEKLASEGVKCRVVSMPSTNLFDRLTKEEQEAIIGTDYSKRIFIEMGSTMPLYKYAKNVYGIDSFGASGPASDVMKHFGFTVDKLVDYIKNI